MKNLNNTGFSLLEVLLAAIIFVVSVSGIFATLSAVRAPVTIKENSLAAAVFGKQVLETLRTNVNATTFYNACANPCTRFDLSLGSHQVTSGTLGITWPTSLLAFPANTTCDANGCLNYTVSCGDGTGTTGDGAAVTCSSSCSGGGCNTDMARQVSLSITSS